jgi:cell division protein FtsI (penicillin-binding protein 3)
MAKPKSIKYEIRLRVYLVYLIMCLFGVAIVWKAVNIQLYEGPKAKAKLKDVAKRYRIDTLQGDRGNIYNEQGLLLTSSIPEFEIAVDFGVISPDTFKAYINALSTGVAAVLGGTPEYYKRKFTAASEHHERYYVLGRKLSYEQYVALHALPVFRLPKGIGGFIADRTERRSTAYNSLAAYTIGKFNSKSSSGLERKYDSILCGQVSYRASKRSGSVWVPVPGSDMQPKNGRDIVTTIDMGIQGAAEAALLHVLQQENCEYGTCIVMETKTGKIRALANLGKNDSIGGRAVDDVYTERFNYALIPTEPGSTFKLVTLLALLKDKYVTPDDIVDAQGGQVQFGGQNMKDSHKGLGKLPIWQAFAKSSNAAMSKLAVKYYKSNPKKFLKHLTDLQLDKATGIDLNGKWPTTVKTVDANWSSTSLPWMAIGYEVAISPLHTCMLYNAVANNGTMVRPYLVSGIREYGKEVVSIQPQVVVDKIADPNTLAQLKRCLRAVVTDGTAKGIESPYYTMSGKTGTAKVADPPKILYEDGVYQGSFVGYLPAEDPQYTVCVVIRTRPNSTNYYGGAIAAPVFRMVADKIFADNIGAWRAPLDSLALHPSSSVKAAWATGGSYQLLLNSLNRPSANTEAHKDELVQLSVDSQKKWIVQPAKIYRNVMPDTRGMGLKDAIYMLESSGLNVLVKGKGRVQSQSIEPGTRIKKGLNVILQLS